MQSLLALLCAYGYVSSGSIMCVDLVLLSPSRPVAMLLSARCCCCCCCCCRGIRPCIGSLSVMEGRQASDAVSNGTADVKRLSIVCCGAIVGASGTHGG